MGKRVLSLFAAAIILSATGLPALAQTFLPQAPQIREMPGSRGWSHHRTQTFLPQAPQIRDYGYRYRRGHYEHRRGHGGGDGLGVVLGILGGLAQATPPYGHMPYGYAPPRRCYTGPEWVWHGYYNGGWMWQNVTHC